MMKASIICLFFICSLVTGQQQINFSVENQIQSQLDQVLTGLSNELRLFGTSVQDNNRLQRQIDFSYEVISTLLEELRPFNSVVQGRGNSINGTNDIVLGSFNNVQGGKNWIFTNYYTGKASGDLILDKYRVQMDKKHLTASRPDLVVFPLNNQQSRKYSKYKNTRSNSGVVSLFKLGSIAQQQIDSYGIQYQSPTQSQFQPALSQFQPALSHFQPSQSQFQQSQSQTRSQFQPSQSQFQPSQSQFQQSQSQSRSQFQPSQSQFQQSRPFGGFQVNQQPRNNNLRGNNNNSGYVDTESRNFGGFLEGSGFSNGPNRGFFRFNWA